MRHILAFCLAFTIIGNAAAAGIADLSNAEAEIGEQEKAFRQNPVGAASSIVRKVLGALGN